MKRVTPPETLQALIFFMAGAMFFLGVTKIIFFLANRHAFQSIKALDILAAFWIDAVTVSLTFIPFTLLWLLPFKKRRKLWYRLTFRILYLSSIAFLCAANLLDVVYYNYAGKRSTFDLFSVLSYEKNMGNHWVTYAKDFWWLALILILCVVLANFFFNRIYRAFIPERLSIKAIPYVFSSILAIALLTVLARGGIGLRPISIISISKLTSPENTGFVSNTAFTMIKSYAEPGMDRLELLPEAKAMKYFNPIHRYKTRPFEDVPENPNVLVVILESFGNEWLGTSRENESYTPFFDSLCAEGYFFPNSYANGTKSIEAMPAVLASIPSLMETPYIASSYASNRVDGVGSMLKKKGYSSAFFHGAAKGSMNFDGFASLIGINSYVGKADYPNQEHSDHTWGIFDHHFLPWVAQQISTLKTPFFSAIFTLSSHHPYEIPKSFEGKLKTGPHPICQSLNYADHALRLFMQEAQKQDWFENTLFVFVADHTAASQSTFYGQRAGKFSIPILYYMPNQKIPKQRSNQISQQIDILPSLLHLMGYQDKFYAFGKSVFGDAESSYAVNYLGGTYHLFFEKFLLTFSGLQNFHLHDLTRDVALENNIFEIKKQEVETMYLLLQAFIQRYNNDLIDNKNHAFQ